ncbi:MAG: hypothetical protein U9P36_02765 [Thermodesulfobacteriota bacterium]|nr:hypothetical protein [Thermodesulfobacteriota bacterium]
MIRVPFMLIMLFLLSLTGPANVLWAEQINAPLTTDTQVQEAPIARTNSPGPEELYDIKGPIPITDNSTTILITAAALLTAALLIALIIFLWKRSRKQQAILAHETALQQLAGAQKLIDAREVDSFITLIDQTLRNYIEARFSISARKQTSREFISGLTTAKRSVPELLTDNSENLQTWLAHCDMVKFAKGTLTTKTMNDMLANLCTFIKATRIEAEK